MKFKWGEKTKHPLYVTWKGMSLRCKSRHAAHFYKYAARGITVCERWRSFENFIEDMGPRPDGFSIDRINNDGNYEPGNCRWADKTTQARNRRYTRPITFNGETKLLSDWAKDMNLNVSTLSARLDVLGWSIERTLGSK